MALITVTAANVGMCYPQQADVFTYIAAEPITAGQSVYCNSSGNAALANGGAAGTAQFKGIALTTVGTGSPVSVCRRGHLFGFTVVQAHDATLFVSDTAGALGDAAGTVVAPIGRVEAITTVSALTKVIFIEANYGAKFS